MLRSATLVATSGAGIGGGFMVVSLNAQTTAQATRQSVWEGLYSDDQAVRGRDAYTRACARCHMDDLGGHEYAGALAGYPFQMKWEDASVAEVFGRIRTMPLGEAGSLSTEEYLDILAYVLQANGYPSGQDELTIGIAAQRWPRIKIERVK